MKVSLIVAMDRNRGIGRDNDLMWHLPNDMRFFKETTENQIVVMELVIQIITFIFRYFGLFHLLVYFFLLLLFH